MAASSENHVKLVEISHKIHELAIPTSFQIQAVQQDSVLFKRKLTDYPKKQKKFQPVKTVVRDTYIDTTALGLTAPTEKSRMSRKIYFLSQ